MGTKWDTVDVGGFTVAGIVVGTLLMMVILGGDIRELGQAICEQEYGMDFNDYSSGQGLVCQPKAPVAREEYDGIKVLLPEGARAGSIEEPKEGNGWYG